MIRFNKSDEETEKWMPCPKNFVEFPGLAYIYSLNQLIVARKQDKLHDIIGLTGKDDVGYTVYNNIGEKVFLVVQNKHEKQYNIKLFNIYGNEVIKMTKTNACLFNKVLVWAPPENYVGSIEECLFDKYDVKNKDGAVVMFIKAKGPLKLYSQPKGEEIGVVMEKREEIPHDNFGVSFPQDLEVGMKVVVLGACFLIGGAGSGCPKCPKCVK